MTTTSSNEVKIRILSRKNQVRLADTSLPKEESRNIYGSINPLSTYDDSEEDAKSCRINDPKSLIPSKRGKNITCSRVTMRRAKEEAKTLSLDAYLQNAGFTILYSIERVNSPKIILAMSPLGTIVAFDLDMEGTMMTSSDRQVRVTLSDGSASISSSYLTNVSKNTDLASIVMCDDFICTLMRDNLGKIGAKHYKMNFESKHECPFATDSPTSYPYINMSDIMDSFPPSGVGVDFNKYMSFLESLREQSDRINNPEIDLQIATLQQNIKFMESLLVNLNNVYAKAVLFNQANKREFDSVSAESVELLRRKLESTVLKQNDSDLWKRNQAQLYELNCNIATIINGMKLFNESRRKMDFIDQETYNFYYTMYTHVLKSMECKDNVEIRRPDGWTLGEALIKSEKLLMNKDGDVSTEELVGKVREDMAIFNPDSHKADTVALMEVFGNQFH